GALVSTVAGETSCSQDRMDIAAEIDSRETDPRRDHRRGKCPLHHLPSCNSATGPSTSTMRTVSFLRLSSTASGTSKRDTIMRSIDCLPMILSRIIRLGLYFCPSCGKYS